MSGDLVLKTLYVSLKMHLKRRLSKKDFENNLKMVLKFLFKNTGFMSYFNFVAGRVLPVMCRLTRGLLKMFLVDRDLTRDKKKTI